MGRGNARVAIGLLIGLSVALFCGSASAKRYEAGETYAIDVVDLVPTQFAVGYIEVEIRMRKILDAVAEGNFKKMRLEETGTAVIAPNGKPYLIDGHHFASALVRAEKKWMYVDIKADYSELSWPAFWNKMRTKGYCHLFDENGVPAAAQDLPKSIDKLHDDRYRALAWLVRKCDGFKKLKIPFQEFQWANFFRERIRFSGASYESWERALGEAMDLAKTTAAADLPGFTGKNGSCKKMLEYLEAVFEARQRH